MATTYWLALLVAAATGSASPDGATPVEPTRAAAPAPPPEVAPPESRTHAGSGPGDAREPQLRKPQNRHVPTPFSDKTTNPSLDASRSTVIPDREALPSELQDIPLAPLGPAPPDVTPTQEEGSRSAGSRGGGPRRVQDIHHAHPAAATGVAPAAPRAATPPAGRAPDPPRTP